MIGGSMVLDKINQENDIKRLSIEELELLPSEIRRFLIESVSKTGGHLASNLGVVELTMAIHLSFDLPKDKIIWDVGHQSYTHKILTGRKEQFSSLRQYKGLSGFPKRDESCCDSFDTGHSSTSISAGIGYAYARKLNREDYRIVVIIGDGAMTGGEAYEALNNASLLDQNFIIILNDNNMSISENVGGMQAHLSNIRTARVYQGFKMKVEKSLNSVPGIGKPMVKGLRKMKSSIKQLIIPGMLFENMGITYFGPIDGHNVEHVKKALRDAKNVQGPVLVHVLTEKGRGYEPATRHPSRFHGTNPFLIENGLPLKKQGPGYTDIFSTVMRKMGDRNAKVVAVTAAMEDGTGLRRFHNMFPERFFDVGIAEQHAVTFCGGLAAGGMIPVFAVYSSFLQRAYDQVVHDICMQNLHVIFAIDRAGLVGSDGQTHHGCFDLSFLSAMPNMQVLAPKNLWELSDMLKYAIDGEGPIAIRYPRGSAYRELKKCRAPIIKGKAEVIQWNNQIALLVTGSMMELAQAVLSQLEELGFRVSLINARFIKPIDEDMLELISKEHELLVTFEDNVEIGGFGQQVLSFCEKKNLDLKVRIVALPDHFIEQGSVNQLREEIDFTPLKIVQRVTEWMKEE